MFGDTSDRKHAKFWQAAKQRGLDDLTVVFEDKFGQFASAHANVGKPDPEKIEKDGNDEGRSE